MNDTLIVSELFGPTIQGEGRSLGRRCVFVRLGRCNLTCRWCDTPFTWDWKGLNGTKYDPTAELQTLTIATVADWCATMTHDLVVISGGEPLLQAAALTDLCDRLRHQGLETEIETNGTLAATELASRVTRFNVSPKLANSGVAEHLRIKPKALRSFTELPNEQVSFKFVATNTDDLTEIDQIVTTYEINPRQVYVMPEGTNSDRIQTHATHLLDRVISSGYNMTTRLHVLLWGNRRGV